jgi:hypothetical protein
VVVEDDPDWARLNRVEEGSMVPVRVRIGLSSVKCPLTAAVEVVASLQVTERVPLMVFTRQGLGGNNLIWVRLRLNVPPAGSPTRQALQVAVPEELALAGAQSMQPGVPGAMVAVPARL